MNHPAPAPVPSPPTEGEPAAVGTVDARTCPRCGSVTERVPRLWSDRLLSLFRPQVRRRCRSFTCSWEGSVRDPGRTSTSPWKRLWAPSGRRSTRL